jgi:glycosyltransferase involved in cell wall biosynthesis
VPAFNESRTIASVVSGAVRSGTPIVVDDGSTDDTGDRARQAGATIVRHDGNRGYDDALNSGFARAAEIGCEYVITLDADGQHDPSIIDRFVAALDAGADIAVGVRHRRQRIGEVVFAWAANELWGLSDPLCGMKAYRIGLYRELGHFDSYGSIGTELALFAAKRGRKIVQIPLTTRDRTDAPRFGRRLSANIRILRAMILGMRRA